MTRIKHIDGIMWASDILNGQKEFSTFNKKKHVSTEDSSAGDFAPIFAAACNDLHGQSDRKAAGANNGT